MQQPQHIQINELKESLVLALDEQSNVKDINEVNRIISILERTHVTREDLEKTRLGKCINDLRRKTADKELAKRTKKLIKQWQQTVVNNNNTNNNNNNSNNNSISNISTLTSPFSNNSISPHGLNHLQQQNNNKSYDSKLTPPTNQQHPALLRVKTQHGSFNCNSNTSIDEKSKNHVGKSSSLSSPTVSPSNNFISNTNNGKTNSAIRPTKNASPKNIYETSINGHKSPKNHIRRSNITPPSLLSVNGVCSPKLQNFKNLFNKKESTISPKNHNNNNTEYAISSSSQHCSPNTFSLNDSSDSFSHNNHNHRNQHGLIDNNNVFHDEDSNSSQLSNLSIDYSNKSEDCSNSKRAYRKRKLEENENDSLRENINYVMNHGGNHRRPQSTQELIEKLNVNLSPKVVKKHNNNQLKHSFSASSSPCIPPPSSTKDSSIDSKRNINNNYHRNGYHKKQFNGFHSEENSLDNFENAEVLQERLTQIKRSNQKTKDILNDNTISPNSSKFCDFYSSKHRDDIDANEDENVEEDSDDDDYYYDDDDDEDEENDENGNNQKSQKSLNKQSLSKLDQFFNKHAQTIDQEIREIYSKLPKVNPDDVELMQQIPFDNDIDNVDMIENDESVVEKSHQTIEEEKENDYDSDEYEVGKPTTTDSVPSSPNNKIDDNETSFPYQTTNSKCDNLNCDNDIVDGEQTLPNDDHLDNDEDEKNIEQQSPTFSSSFDKSITNSDDNDDEDREKPPPKLVKLIIRKRRRKSQVKPSKSIDDNSKEKRMAKYIERLANEQWEYFNGNYDKDGVWHDFSEMTSSYVLTSQNDQSEENVLHILPYVNCTWL